jgi:hypothetical protein
MIYQWKDGSRYAIDPQKAGELLAKLADNNGGEVHAGEVVDAARRKSSVIHDAFEWDNEVAAEEFRKVTARELLRSITTVEIQSSGEEQKVRAFFAVTTETGSKAYVPTLRVLSMAEMRAELLESVLTQLETLRDKYSHLGELGEVWDVIAEQKAQRDDKSEVPAETV